MQNVELKEEGMELNEKETEKLPMFPVFGGAEKSGTMNVKLAEEETIKVTEIHIKDVELNMNDIDNLPLATTVDSTEKNSMVQIEMANTESEKVNKSMIKDVELNKNDTELNEDEKLPLATMVGSGDNNMLEVNVVEEGEMKVMEMYNQDEELSEKGTANLSVADTAGSAERNIMVEVNMAQEEEVKVTEIDMEDVQLNETDTDLSEDMETLPLATRLGSTEKKDMVKLTVEEGVKVTGLSKEELLNVAWTPVWVCTRWALLIFFWLGWLGMLVGAIVILLHAPHCKDLPKLRWWQKGVIYQIGAIEAFQDSDFDGIGDLAGVQRRLDDLKALKVKGLVIGPIHVTVANNAKETRLKDVDPRFGTLTNFIELLEAAKKKNIRVILDVTPNYKGEKSWFNTTVMSNNAFQSDIKEAVRYWLENGVAGIRVGGIEQLKNLGLLEEWKTVTSNYNIEGNSRILVAATDDPSSENILSLVNETNCDVLSSRYLLGLEVLPSGDAIASKIKNYITAARLRWMSWSVGGPQVGHMASLVPEKLLRLYHIMLFTLPGTPFTNYGDEIGLKDLPEKLSESNSPIMQWDSSPNFGFSSLALEWKWDVNRNTSVMAQKNDKLTMLSLFKELSELKGRELSLLHGEFLPVQTSRAPCVYAYLRSWDQKYRFLTVLNFGDEKISVALQHKELPVKATVVISSDPKRKDDQMDLQQVHLAPFEGLLLKFPYSS